MAGPRLGVPLALRDFLDGLEDRLQGLSAQEIVAALVTHAERLPAEHRQGFLDIFPDARAQPSDGAQPQAHLLLADIDAFADRARAGEFDREEQWYDDRYDRDRWDDDWPEDGADTSWAPEADALFAAAGEAFISGRLDLARDAYGRLLRLFTPIDRGGSDLDTWSLETTDMDEAVVRHLRSVYETTPPLERATALHQAYATVPSSTRPPRLRDVAAARRGDLPDLDVFLPRWIDCLLTGTTPQSAGHRQRLLTEATILHQGVDGLAGLARRSGSHQAGTYLAWIDALTDHGRPEDAADAAREALTLATATAAHLARAADRLAELTTSLGDPIGAVDARRQAWRAQPTRERLLALALAGEAAGNLAQTLAVEANGVRGHDRMACELLLLAGHVETAAAALTRASPLGWSRPTHPGPVVLPYLLVAATAAAPPAAQESQLGQAFAAIDLAFQPPPYLDPSLDFDADLDPDFDPDANIDLDAHAETGGGADDPADHPTPPLTAFLTRSILEHAGTQRQRRQWLAAARTAIEQRVDAIVSNKHRRAYKQAASLTVSYAEALIITGAVGGPEYIAGIRQKYPRHTAFRSELDAATRTSTLASGTR